METDWKKNAALFLTGQALSYFGTMVVQYAIFWHVVLKSQSGSVMTLFAIVGLFPMFLISPFAGVWADRFNRKRIINIADGSVAFFSLCMAVSLMLGVDSYAMLFVCALMRALGNGVQAPAVSAFIPMITPPEHLTKINGIHSGINSFAALTSPMIAAALMAAAPLAALFFLDVVTAAAGIGTVLFFVKAPPQKQTARPQGGAAYFHDLKEGMRYIRAHGYILRMIVVSATFLFAAAPAAFLTPLQSVRKFGGEVWRLSAIEIGFSSGMMLGGFLIGIWGGLKNRVHTMALSSALCGLITVGLGVVPAFWLYIALMAALGIVLPLYNAPSAAVLQTNVDPAFMGRVLSVFTMLSGAMMPLGMLIFGPLADVVSIDRQLMLTGAATALLCIPMMTSKTLRAAGARRSQSAEGL
ncbi:MAG: MFS transporter [Chitinispirillales bacterium]|jgi:DHA3 family macrolide efflux protein-like MFS transporter|nr:MFS transporter [Chitinispirillales bacterium]